MKKIREWISKVFWSKVTQFCFILALATFIVFGGAYESSKKEKNLQADHQINFELIKSKFPSSRIEIVSPDGLTYVIEDKDANIYYARIVDGKIIKSFRLFQ